MTRLHGIGFPLGSFSHGRYLANGVEVLPEVVTGMAGNARLLYEWASGGPIPGVAPCAPRAPHSGTQGHDHSGGVMGAPIQHTLWSHAMGMPAELLTDDVKMGTAIRNQVNTTATRAGLYDNGVEVWWVPGCPPDGCYWTLQLHCFVYASAAADLVARWALGGWETEQTKALTGGALNSIYFDTPVPTQPGRRQSLRLGLTAEYVAATSDVSLCFLGLSQIAATS